jgi:hypothetical protein
MNRWALAIAAVLLANCSPPSPQATQVEQPQPSAAMRETFRDCTWGDVRGAEASIWSFSCPQDRLAYDSAIPGFAREIIGPEGGGRAPVIRLFDIAEGAAIETILPAIRAASPADGIESCTLAPEPNHAGWFVLMPTGALLDAYNQFRTGAADGPSLPCGILGPSEAGERVFFMLPGAADKVAFVELGSEIQPFDVSTLRASR